MGKHERTTVLLAILAAVGVIGTGVMFIQNREAWQTVEQLRQANIVTVQQRGATVSPEAEPATDSSSPPPEETPTFEGIPEDAPSPVPVVATSPIATMPVKQISPPANVGEILSDEMKRKIVQVAIAATPDQRWKALAGLGITLSNQDFETILNGMGDDWRAIGEMTSVLAQWAQQDPQAAAQWVDKLPQGPKKQQATATVMANWSRADTNSAIRWLQSMPEGDARDQAIANLVNQNAARDPLAALEYFRMIKNDNIRLGTVPTLARELAKKDVNKAAEWISSLPEGRLRDQATQQFVVQIAPLDPEAAMEWAETIGDENMRRFAIPYAVGQWTKTDAAAVSEWLLKQPAGQMRDMAVQNFAIRLASSVPEKAVEWAQTISSEGIRSGTLTSIASTWLRDDREAAVRWLADAPLPEGTKRALLQRAASSRSDMSQGE